MCVALRGSAWQCIAVCCRAQLLQTQRMQGVCACVAVRGSVLQCVEGHSCSRRSSMCRLCECALQCVAVCGSVWQCCNACHCVSLCATVGCVRVRCRVCKCEVACGSVAMCVLQCVLQCVSLCITVRYKAAQSNHCVQLQRTATNTVCVCVATVYHCVSLCITVYHCVSLCATVECVRVHFSVCKCEVASGSVASALLCLTVCHGAPSKFRGYVCVCAFQRVQVRGGVWQCCTVCYCVSMCATVCPLVAVCCSGLQCVAEHNRFKTQHARVVGVCVFAACEGQGGGGDGRWGAGAEYPFQEI